MTIEQLAQLHIPIPPMLEEAIGYDGQARQRPLPPAEVLVADYLGGLSMHKIAQKYHVNIRRIRPVLVSTGVLGKLRGITFAKTRGLPRKDWAHSQTMSQELTSGEWGYIAGIFDGEGSVKWHLEWHPGKQTETRILIAQKGRELHDWLVEKLRCGQVEPYSRHRNDGCFRFVLNRRREVFDFLVGIAPYVVVKREKVFTLGRLLAERYGWNWPYDLPL